jgi:hypothetical protein
MQSGLIEVNGKQGSANITYKLKTSSKFDEVSNEVSSEVGIEVSIEVDTKLDATKDKLNKTKLNNKNSEILPEKFPFERAWELYGRKGNKKTSMRKWGSLKNDCREAAMKHIPPYVKATPDKQYRKNFETYLNQEAWHDEIVSPTMAQKQKKEDHYGYKESECVG